MLTLLSMALAPSALAAPGTWQPGPDAVGDNTYAGVIDLPVNGSSVPSNQSVTISGWVVDQSAEGWAGIDNVHVYDGLAGQGGTFLGQAMFAQSRPDVAQALGNPFFVNSGFALTVGAGVLAAGPHTLSVYAHTPAKGWWFTQASVTAAPAVSTQPVLPPTQPSAAAGAPVNVLLRPSMVTISKQQDHYTIHGYALDPSATSDVGTDHIDLYMDEQRGHGGTYLGRASLGQDSPEAAGAYGARFEQAGYQLDFKPVNFNVGDHHIYSYAVSSLTGQETVAVTGFKIGP